MSRPRERLIRPEDVSAALAVDRPEGAHLRPIAEAVHRGATLVMATCQPDGEILKVTAAPLNPRGTIILLDDSAGGGPKAFEDSVDLEGLARFANYLALVASPAEEPRTYADASTKALGGGCAVVLEATGEAARAWWHFVRSRRSQAQREPAQQP